MTPDELVGAAWRLHGRQHGAVAALAQRLGVAYDSLRHMAAGRRPIPPGLAAEVRALLAAPPPPQQACVTIPPPPPTLRPDDDRDAPCGEALNPALDALAAAAMQALGHALARGAGRGEVQGRRAGSRG